MVDGLVGSTGLAGDPERHSLVDSIISYPLSRPPHWSIVAGSNWEELGVIEAIHLQSNLPAQVQFHPTAFI